MNIGIVLVRYATIYSKSLNKLLICITLKVFIDFILLKRKILTLICLVYIPNQDFSDKYATYFSFLYFQFPLVKKKTTNRIRAPNII